MCIQCWFEGYAPKRRKAVCWTTPLKEFTLFPKLPPEIRTIIWQFTLEPRIVKPLFDARRGFYTHTKTPSALQISKNSRNAVLPFYPASFGRAFFKPQIRFNFSLDTLYFETYEDVEIHHFFGILSRFELSSIRSIAIDSHVNMDWEICEDNPIDYLEFFRKNARALSGLKEFRLVHQAELYFGESIPEGIGPMKFYRFLPDELKPVWFEESGELSDLDIDDEEELETLFEEDIPPPDHDNLLIPFDFPAKCENVWGWTPTFGGV